MIKKECLRETIRYFNEYKMNKKNILKEKNSNIAMERAFRMLKYLEKSLKERGDHVIYATGHTYRSENEIKSIERKLPVKELISFL